MGDVIQLVRRTKSATMQLDCIAIIVRQNGDQTTIDAPGIADTWAHQRILAGILFNAAEALQVEAASRKGSEIND